MTDRPGGSFRPLRTALLCLLLAVAGASTALATAATPPPGSPLRRAILDSLRPMVEAELGAPVEFVVNDLRVLGEWAFVYAKPQRPGGAAIGYAYTRYQQAFDDGAFEEGVSALLRETPAGWLVYEYALGATDPPWLNWGDAYPVPPEVFPMH